MRHRTRLKLVARLAVGLPGLRLHDAAGVHAATSSTGIAISQVLVTISAGWQGEVVTSSCFQVGYSPFVYSEQPVRVQLSDRLIRVLDRHRAIASGFPYQDEWVSNPKLDGV